MVCYRRHGHNEGDDPSYTQPLMYAKIEQRRSVRKLFTESLVKRGQLSLEEAEGALDDFQKRLQTALEETRQTAPTSEVLAKAPPPAGRRAAPRRDRRGPGRARPRLRRAVHVPRHLPGAPEAAQAVRGARQALGRRRGRLGAGRGDGLRLAAPRGHRHPHGRPGHPSGHLQPPPRGARRPHQRRRVRAARPPRRRAGQVLDLRLAAVGVRRPRLRVRLLGRRQGLARGVGGAVRRLLERRLHDRRPVRRVGRGQVEPDRRPRAVPAPRLRGPGSRAQLRSRRAVPHPVRRGQHPGRQLHPGVADLPPAPPPGAPRRAQAARGLHAEVAAAGPVHALTGRASCSRATSARRSTIPASPTRAPSRRVVLATGKVEPRRPGRARRGRRAGGGGAGRAALPVALRPARRDRRPLPERHGPRVAPGGAREHGRRGAS